MSTRACSISKNASFQAFANCYLREVDAGSWKDARTWQDLARVSLRGDESHVVVLSLASIDRELAIGVAFRSLVGRHTLTVAHVRRCGDTVWRPLDHLSTELLLIDAIYAHRPGDGHRLELMSRVLESHRVMSEYVSHALHDDFLERRGSGLAFIESEQSTVFGHWLHPTPKSRQGFLPWHHAHYAPERSGRFQLHFFAARRSIVRQESLADASAEQIAQHIALCDPRSNRYQEVTSGLSEEYCLVPVHPLQAQWLLHQAHVQELLATGQLLELGRLGARFTPTSSVRTVYCEDLDYMVKLSIPVKLTNSLRVNLGTELGDSVWVSQLCRKLRLSERYPNLHILQDPAYITVDVEDREASGFEVIFRDNPFCRRSREQSNGRVHSIAALVQDPLSTSKRSLLARLVGLLAAQRDLSIEQAVREWFDAYFDCSIRTSIELYDGFGIALEAHQQNSLLGFDETGLPVRSYYRDIQGLSLLESFRAELVARVPELALQPKIFEPDDVVREGFGYYLFFNQLYSVVNRLALDSLVEERTLLALIRSKLSDLRTTMVRSGADFIDAMLSVDDIACKANLLTRVADVDELETENELGVYASVPNPLRSELVSGAFSDNDFESEPR